jgi:hypothetical protein|tara:strand:- start:279 stop:506 length:228 start_codon:yes stop_codon:yes gene_type:complete
MQSTGNSNKRTVKKDKVRNVTKKLNQIIDHMSDMTTGQLPTSVPASSKRTRPGTALVQSGVTSSSNLNLVDSRAS